MSAKEICAAKKKKMLRQHIVLLPTFSDTTNQQSEQTNKYLTLNDNSS
jgi:hypothetical protein